MEKPQNLLTRDDTMFGVCEALGEDLNFNPLWLRITLAVGLLWSPMAVAIAYGSLAVLVLVSRLIFPNPRRALAPQVEPAEPAAAEAEAERLPIAA